MSFLGVGSDRFFWYEIFVRFVDVGCNIFGFVDWVLFWRFVCIFIFCIVKFVFFFVVSKIREAIVI